MRILVLTEHFLPAVGGSITWLVNTYSRFCHDEVVFLASSQVGDRQCDAKLPFPVMRIPMSMQDWDPTILRSLLRYIHLIWRAYRSCRNRNIQQIHCAKVLPEGLVAYSLRCLHGIPYLIYAHGEEIQLCLRSRKLQWLIPKIYRGASAIIANSSNTMCLLENLGIPLKKVHIVHPGVDTRFFKQASKSGNPVRQRFNLGSGPILLTVGRLQQRKGHDMVIRALPLIKEKFPQAMYLIVGSGEELSRLHSLANEVGVTNSVLFVGHIQNQELPEYYEACDVFIMPNREVNGDIEGFGMVYIEASACGKPVIGGQSGGTSDAILDMTTGLRVDGTDIVQIADAVNFILGNADIYQNMGENGRRWVEQEFTWDTVVHKTQLITNTL